jgi:hypothetical protein
VSPRAEAAAARAQGEGIAPARADDGARRDVARASPTAAVGEPGSRAGPAFPEGAGEPLHRLVEHELYARHRAEAQRDLRGFEAAAPALVFGDGPIANKVAVLRALEDARAASTVPMLARAIRELPVASTARSTSLPSFALRRLVARADGDAEARRALRAAAFGPGASPDAALRLRAAAALARASTESEARAIETDLPAQVDPLLAQAFRAGLQSNPRITCAGLLPVASPLEDDVP